VKFCLSPELQSFQETLDKFSRVKVRPQAAAAESAGQAPLELLRELHRLGYSRCQFPEAYGGLGDAAECLQASILAAAEIARGCAGIALAAPGPGPLAQLLLVAGSEEQKQTVLPRFARTDPVYAGYSLGQGLFPADLSRVEVEARPEPAGYILQGRQSWVLNFDRASWFVITARVGPAGQGGIEWFLLPRDTPGLSAKARLSTMGLAAAPFGEMMLAECRVPREARLGEGGSPAGLEAAWCRAGLVMAAMAAGIIEACLEYCLGYAEDRVQFGAPIVEREAIALMLAEMKQDLELGQSRLGQAAKELGSKTAALEPAALALAFLGPAGVKHAVNAVQILGGYGFTRDYPCEKWLRDAKTLEVLLGGAERQQLWVLERLRRPHSGQEHEHG
jgi:acyl-CoA dehydrogenase